jgi:hypothetical protein
MCSILCWILSIWEAQGWNFCIFGLIHAFSTRGEVWACFGLLDASRRFSGGFEPFLGYVGLTGGVERSDRSELSWCSCSVFIKWFACIRPGGVALVQGSLHVCRGSSLWVSSLVGGLRSLLEHSFISDVSSRCPSLRVRDLSYSGDLSLCLCLAFDRLLKFLFICFFPFSFLSGYYMCVLSVHSSRGRLRTKCGSRTGGWSLPCVMSDWQRCVDWLLAKYCRCRLRLD